MAFHSSWNAKEALSRIRLPGTEWFGIREVREKTTFRMARDENPETNVSEETHGAMVEVLVNGQFGYAATSQLDDAGIRAAAERALEQAASAAKFPVFRFTKEQRPASKGKYLSPREKTFGSSGVPGAGELNQHLIQITRKLKVSEKIIRTLASLRVIEMTWRYVSTSGTDIEQDFLLMVPFYSATAKDGSVIQTRTNGGWEARSYQSGFEILEEKNLWDQVKKVGEQAVELLSAEECPETTTSLVLMPDQMMLQIHESIGHPLEVDRILGDERNYAGSSFVKLEDFGKLVYGSPLMNITFDPGVRGEFASYGFDDSGFESRREYLIQGGILLRGLGGLESQARSGVPGVANFRASSWNRPPVDRMANLNLEPGDSSFDEIVSSVESGVLMEANRSWSIDDYRNKFQFGCEYAKLIENGRITKTLRNPNYRGITVPFWKGLKKVGNRSTFEVYGTPHCGKAEPNQAIRVGHASPVCLFENVEIFGGGK